MMKNKLLLFLIFIFAGTFAQVPYLIKDINKNTNNSESSSPSQYFSFNGKSLFMATSLDYGRELWITNGTASGTTLLKDINSGSGSSVVKNFIVFNNKVFFVANNGSFGNEIWSSDGTSAGTKMLLNLNTANDFNANDAGNVSKFAIYGGKLYFRIIINRKEYLYRTDGTEAGTSQISLLSNNSFLINEEMFAYFGKIYFDSSQTNGNPALYAHDIDAQVTSIISFGTATRYKSSNFCYNNSGFYCILEDSSNTIKKDVVKINSATNAAVSVKMIAPDNQNYEMFSWLNMIYFTAKTVNEGVELWKSDGTVAGTTLTTDLFAGASSSNPSKFEVLSGDIIFEATSSAEGRELFKYNISTNQTTVIKDLTVGGNTNFSFMSRIILGQYYYFVINVAGQQVFYRTDGTASGTVTVSDVLPPSSNINYESGFGYLNGDLIMSKNYIGNTSSYDNLGYELYKFNVAFEEFSLVKNINFSGSTYTLLDVYGKINNDFIFTSSHKDFGNELWKTDKSPNNATLIKDQNAGVNNVTFNNIANLVFNNTLYFAGNIAAGNTYDAYLFKTDGTATGSKQIYYSNTAPASRPTSFTVFNNVLYFLTDNGKLSKIVNDVAVEVHTYSLGQSFLGSQSSMIVNNGELYQLIIRNVSTSATSRSIELWKLNNTGTTNTLVKTISISTTLSNNIIKLNMASFNNVLYFPCYSVAEGVELWKSDGTDAGTVLLKNISIDANYPNSNPNSFVAYNNELFFIANEGANYYLWKTNGTTAGTMQLKNKKIRSDLKSIVFDSKLFFIVRDINVDEVYASDGTEIGTALFYNVPGSPYLAAPIVYQNKLLISSQQQNEVYALNSFATAPYLYFKKLGNSEGLFKNVNESLFMTSTYNKNNAEYGQELWVLGNCVDTANAISGASSTANIVEEKLNSTTTCYCDEWNSLLVKLQSVGTTPFVGAVNSNVWVDGVTTQNYVKRHYQIVPQQNISTATGTMTLYFYQQEFTEYNALNPNNLLPTNATDVANKANLLIERFAAVSTDGTGSPISYAAAGANIDPVDANIVWNATLNRWEVTFTGNLFGGYFVKSKINSLDIDQNLTLNKINIYPNPTSGIIKIDVLEQSKCSVYDFTGKLIQSKSIDTSVNTIDLSTLPNGIYLLSIENGKQTISTKIIKR